jgi:hypothetical protein
MCPALSNLRLIVYSASFFFFKKTGLFVPHRALRRFLFPPRLLLSVLVMTTQLISTHTPCMLTRQQQHKSALRSVRQLVLPPPHHHKSQWPCIYHHFLLPKYVVCVVFVVVVLVVVNDFLWLFF